MVRQRHLSLARSAKAVVARRDDAVKMAFERKKDNSGSPSLVLDQDFTAMAPNEKYAGDITYFLTDYGWFYLATVIDLYSRMMVSWTMSERMTEQMVCDAMKITLWHCGIRTDVIVNADCCSQHGV